MALTLAKRDHDWVMKARGGDTQSRLICEKIFSDDWRAEAPHGIPARLLDAYNLAPCATDAAFARLLPAPYSDAHWRAIREYRYVMPAVQTGAGSGWAAGYLSYPTEPCSACAEMDGWGCREHQRKI
jgi:hypothetical protein